MIWQSVRGHAAQVEMFRRSIERERLSHSYLFVGDEGIGKKLFAQTLGQCLLCERCDDALLDACGKCSACRQFQAGTHPDFISIGRLEGKSELTIDLIAGSRERRGREGLCYELSLRPSAGNRKIAVIDDANLMNAESANALLKTLEEPPPYCMLFLIATDANALLPTIRSRCQQIRFAPLQASDVAELLVSLEMVDDPSEATQLAELSNGSLATAEQLIEPALRDLRTLLYESLADEKFNSVLTSKKVLEGLDTVGGDARAQRQAAGWLIRFIIEFYRRTLRELTGEGSVGAERQVTQFVERLRPASTSDFEMLAELVDRGALAEGQLQKMSPVPLCIEGLLNDLGKMMRANRQVAG